MSRDHGQVADPAAAPSPDDCGDPQHAGMTCDQYDAALDGEHPDEP